MKVGKVVVILSLVVALSGCIVLAAAAGGSGALYIKGAAKKSYPYGVERTFKATLAAVEDAGIVVYEKKYDQTSGQIAGNAADGKKLKVHFKALGDKVTEVKIRVGTLGDRARSEQIIEKIDARLK